MIRKSGITETKNEVKKMRVEKVVTALCKGENVTGLYEYANDNDIKSGMTSPVYSTDSSPEPASTLSRKRSKSDPNVKPKLPNSEYEKQTISVIPAHPPPLLIRPQPMIPCGPTTFAQNVPFFPVPRIRGIHIKSDKNSIMKVPRDEKFPFNIYDPNPPSHSTKKVKPYSSVKPYKNLTGNTATTKAQALPTYRNYAKNNTDQELKTESVKAFDNFSTTMTATTSTSTESVKKDIHVIQNDNCIVKKKLSSWSIEEVYNYLKTSDCFQYASIFLEQEIDGQALELLDETNISKCLGVKMGPAIKLNCTIQKLRKTTNSFNE